MSERTIAPGFATAEDWYRAACGVVVKRLREARGWSFREFAEHAGAAHTSLYEIERGNNTPGIDVLARVAEACDLTLPALLSLIVDELRAAHAAEPTSLSAVTEAAADLSGAQRAETTRFMAWLRFRDAEESARDAR